MTMTTINVTTIEPLAHHEAMRRQAYELERTLELLRSLDDASWNAATDCPPGMSVRYQHVLGACEAGASVRENIGQLRRARAYRRQHGGPLEAALGRGECRGGNPYGTGPTSAPTCACCRPARGSCSPRPAQHALARGGADTASRPLHICGGVSEYRRPLAVEAGGGQLHPRLGAGQFRSVTAPVPCRTDSAVQRGAGLP